MRNKLQFLAPNLVYPFGFTSVAAPEKQPEASYMFYIQQSIKHKKPCFTWH